MSTKMGCLFAVTVAAWWICTAAGIANLMAESGRKTNQLAGISCLVLAVACGGLALFQARKAESSGRSLLAGLLIFLPVSFVIEALAFGHQAPP